MDLVKLGFLKMKKWPKKRDFLPEKVHKIFLCNKTEDF